MKLIFLSLRLGDRPIYCYHGYENFHEYWKNWKCPVETIGKLWKFVKEKGNNLMAIFEGFSKVMNVKGENVNFILSQSACRITGFAGQRTLSWSKVDIDFSNWFN